MADKYYAVKRGVKIGIFRTWEECRASVNGYSGAVYKSFGSRQEALDFLGEEAAAMVESSGEEPAVSGEDAPDMADGCLKTGQLQGIPTGKDMCECLEIYVDGSFNSETNEFSYGMVVLNGDREEKYSQKFEDRELASMRNVAGEIKGAQAAMQYAIDHGIKEIAIYHDYEGIAKWCLGQWKANKEGTKAYRDFYDRACRQVKIRFVKVKGHSKDKYNDMADELAKKALGI